MTFATDFLKRLQNRIELIEAIEAEAQRGVRFYACRFQLVIYGEIVSSDLENGILCTDYTDNLEINLDDLRPGSEEYFWESNKLKNLLVFGKWVVKVTQDHDLGELEMLFELDHFSNLDDISEQFRQDTGIAAYEYKFEQQYERPDRD